MKVAPGIAPDWAQDYDWVNAFSFAHRVSGSNDCGRDPFGIDDVSEVIAAERGENDGASWIMAGRLMDGRFFFLSAGCDYTGWDCQAWGDSHVSATLQQLIVCGMTRRDRERLADHLRMAGGRL